MKTNIRKSGPAARQGIKALKLVGVLAVMTFFLNGCYYLVQANRYIARTGSVPWFCQGTPDLSASDCTNFAASMDQSVKFASDRWTYQDGLNAGGTPLTAGSRTLVFGSTAIPFNVMAPNTIHYESNAATARAMGVAWRISSVGAPAGFPGNRDVWIDDGSAWELNLWVLRGYEYHADIMAATHPCEASLPLTATTDACYLASHTVPLEILVVNDDGYFAEGIDELVAALTDDPNDPIDSFVAGVNVTVVAPLTQQSGQGGNTTPGGAPAATPGLTTASGYPVLAAVHGTPADSANWAFKTLNLSPDLVMSGINEGQNLANVGHLASGTVGAARAGVRSSTHAIATSQESLGVAPDWHAGVAGTLDLLERWRIGDTAITHMALPNINIPSCAAGSAIRGTVETVVALSVAPRPYGPTNCFSTDPAGADDMDAFLNGFIGIADMGKDQPPNYP